MPGELRVACLSDTHMRHAAIRPVEVDLVVHAGDFTRRGTLAEAQAFLAWLGRWPAAHKVAIAGNHDTIAEREPERVRAIARDHGVTYLCDEAAQIAGLALWGSPWTPRFASMAFNLDRGAALAERWAEIPNNLDLLITHGPPRGIGDRMALGLRVGCADLRAAVQRARPRLHVFGHIHEAAGIAAPRPGYPTRSVNAASCRLIHRLPPRPPRIVRLAVG